MDRVVCESYQTGQSRYLRQYTGERTLQLLMVRGEASFFREGPTTWCTHTNSITVRHFLLAIMFHAYYCNTEGSKSAIGYFLHVHFFCVLSLILYSKQYSRGTVLLYTVPTTMILYSAVYTVHDRKNIIFELISTSGFESCTEQLPYYNGKNLHIFVLHFFSFWYFFQ